MTGFFDSPVCRRHAHRRIALLLVLCLAAAAAATADDSRTFAFTYRAAIGPIEAGRGPVHVFVPLALENGPQRILSERVQASIPGRVEIEDRYGNRYWHGSVDASNGEPIRVEVTTEIERRAFHREAPAGGSRGLADAERQSFQRFLSANERVAVGHAVLTPILAEIRAAARSENPAALARATYDWVVDNLEYKKVGSGWGNGDTFWACSERYGNCTDFHALFISLARTQQIPARFEIGFPIPEDRAASEIGGYHCWVQFYLPETGWFPIDASEAFKHPEKRDLFYGTQPADRIHFTTGRDLRLGGDHRGRPLNYFIHPYVEVAGAPYRGPIEKSFAYRALADQAAGVR